MCACLCVFTSITHFFLMRCSLQHHAVYLTRLHLQTHLGYGNGVCFMGFLMLSTRKKHGYFFFILFHSLLTRFHKVPRRRCISASSFFFHTFPVTIGHIYITLSRSRKHFCHICPQISFCLNCR
ncbi:hypothetical protein LI328DRAFT_98129 [Trichoderma asperelloides]|nr:hypothetical protein LI328DRAFT_98129 [Trichoderma asperelloides]